DEGVEAADDRKLYGIPRLIRLADGREIDTRKGTVPQKSTFSCQRCGMQSDLLTAVKESNDCHKTQGAQPQITECSSSLPLELNYRTAPMAPYAIQGYCPCCDKNGEVYGGRFFSRVQPADLQRIVSAEKDWHHRSRSDLAEYWPKQSIPHGLETHIRKPLGSW